jgi:hypothetical protein
MKFLWIFLLLLLPLCMITAQDQDSEGDDKILETIKKIQEEAEKEAEEEDYDSEDDEDGCFGCQLLAEGCSSVLDSVLGELLWQYFVSLRFAPYPYAAEAKHPFSSFEYQDFDNQKVTSIQVGADLSTHFDGTYGNSNRLTAQLSALQLNLFNQTIFSSSVSLSALSVNAGLSLLIGGFDLSAFAGTYLVTTTGTFMPSVGLSSRVFLGGGLYLDLYNLYAFLNGRAQFLHLITSLNFAIWRFSIGVGYNYNLIVGDIYSGPCVKISFWL